LGEKNFFDVIVVGGGPGGSVAAKICAEKGFSTLLIEKRRLPRKKVCSGMIMGPWANEIINQEFGEIPLDILTAPHYLSGQMIHLPDLEPRAIEHRIPIAWRKDLDYWMNIKAENAGVQLLDRAKLVKLSQEDNRCILVYEREKVRKEVKATYVIGADGAASAARKNLFPDLKVKYSAPLRECYSGSIEFDKKYIHWFFPKYSPRPRFDLLHKGNTFLIEGSGIRILQNEIKDILSEHGFNNNTKLLWRDGCLMPRLHEYLLDGTFIPASGNALLIGDAACLVLPITFEGIGSSLKSGLIAAHSIELAARLNKDAASVYLKELELVTRVVKRLYSLQENIKAQSEKGPDALADALKSAYEQTLEVT